MARASHASGSPAVESAQTSHSAFLLRAPIPLRQRKLAIGVPSHSTSHLSVSITPAAIISSHRFVLSFSLCLYKHGNLPSIWCIFVPSHLFYLLHQRYILIAPASPSWTLTLSPKVRSCGVTTHTVIAHRAAERFLDKGCTFTIVLLANRMRLAHPEFVDMIKKHPDAFFNGAAFPDFGYDCPLKV